ncbi:MAG: hypothetical protein ACK4TB_17110 [Gemmobacter sp.]
MSAAAPFAAAVLGVAAAAAWAEVPPPACEGMEAGMVTHRLTILDPATGGSGITLERYQVDMQPDGSPQGVYRALPAPVPALDGFFGVRVVHCASGAFHAIDTQQSPETVAAALAATEHLRAEVQAGRRVGQAALSAAVRAVYGRTVQLRETDETCGCAAAFPDLRPQGMTPFGARGDTRH